MEVWNDVAHIIREFTAVIVSVNSNIVLYMVLTCVRNQRKCRRQIVK